MAAIESLERQLRVASSNNTALQRQQAQLMASVHTLINMVASTTGIHTHTHTHKFPNVFSNPLPNLKHQNLTTQSLKKCEERPKCPRSLRFMLKIILRKTQHTHTPMSLHCICCVCVCVCSVTSWEPDVEGLCRCVQGRSLCQRSVSHLHQQQDSTCAGNDLQQCCLYVLNSVMSIRQTFWSNQNQ